MNNNEIKDAYSTYRNVLLELLGSRIDSTSTKNEKYAEQLHTIHEQFEKRNMSLTELLDSYMKQRDRRIQTNNFFKKFLFWFLVGVIAILTAIISTVFITVDYKNIDNISSVVALISVAVTYLTSILSIFKIMTKYLFPADEEKDAISMISTVIKNDLKVEKITNKAIDNLFTNDITKASNEAKTLKLYKDLLDSQVISQEEYDQFKKYILQKYNNN